MTQPPSGGPCEEPRSILAGGLRFAYLDSGGVHDENRPLVLLLHGFPDDAYTFDELRPTLAAAGYHAVAVFLRGYHPSDVPADGDSSPLTLGRDVLALIAAFGAADAVVIGHDWGAIAGYLAASLAPERVRRLVAMGIPHARALRPTPRQVWRARHFVYLTMPWAARAMRRTDLAYVDRFNHRMSPRWAPPAEHVDRLKAALALPGRLEAALDYYRDVAGALFHRSSRRVILRPISVPTLAVAGAEDGGVSPATMRTAAKYFTADYRLHVVPGAGHFMHRERPAEVAAEVLAFLRSNGS